MNTFTSLFLVSVLCAEPPAVNVETTPYGRRLPLIEGATLFVPRDFRPTQVGRIDLVLHLHGATSVVEPAFAESGWPAALVVFNRPGLSSVYTKPFSDPTLFPRLIDAADDGLKKLDVNAKLGRVVLSTFSAGFGGAREILKAPSNVDRLHGLVVADSIYCGYTGDPQRKEVDPALMAGFRAFALSASAGRKTMLVSHSAQVPGTYASTTETADFLLNAVGAATTATDKTWAGRWVQTREGQKGKFLVVGFAGAGAADHMSHLRQIARLWKRYQELDAAR